MFTSVRCSTTMSYNPLQFLVLPLIIGSTVAVSGECDKKDKSNCSNVTSNNNKLKLESFIIGGKLTKILRFPHAICLFQYSTTGDAPHSFCGASVLNQRILLTAAHCVDEDNDVKYNMYAYGGHEDLEKVKIIRRVNRYIKHENYDRESTQNDIALLFLDSGTIPLGGSSPIKRGIISKQFPFHIEYAEVSGWGLVNDESHQTSTLLKMTKQKVYPLDVCEEEYEWMPGMMCAGDMDSDKNRPARGDSGSGLVTPEYQIIGIVSFTVSAHPGLIIYTNISDYYDWIVKYAYKNVCPT